jgi:hypothetical protein
METRPASKRPPAGTSVVIMYRHGLRASWPGTCICKIQFPGWDRLSASANAVGYGSLRNMASGGTPIARHI